MKKVMRSVLLLALAGVMVFSMAACGEKKVEETPVETPVVDETDISTSDLNTEVVEVSLTLADIVDTLSATYGENFRATMKLEPDVLETLVGISPDMYEEVYAAQAPTSAHCDMLIVLRAVEDKAADVEKILNDYRTSRIDSTVEYPANLPRIEASVVDVQYDFIIFRMLGAIYEPKTTEDGEVVEAENEAELISTFYAEETEKGTVALNDLYEMGFTAMTEEERAEKGIDALYPAEEVEVTETEEVEVTEEDKEEATETEATETEEVEATEEEKEEATEVEVTATEKVEDAVEEAGKVVGEVAGEVAEEATEAVKEATENSDAE